MIVIIIAVIVVVLLIFIGFYNRLVRLRNRVNDGWSQIDVQLKRRYDLIPNLIETVKGYATHEKTVLEDVTKARAGAISAGGAQEKGQAENALTQTLRSLFAVAENYPQLKANENFAMLQEELSGTESKIAYSRQFYNDSVMAYQNARQAFPTNIIAGLFNFEEKHYFEMENPEEREPVKVKF